MTVEISNTTPESFTLSSIADSGTQALQLISGFETDSCGPFKVTQLDMLSLVAQDSVDQLLFTVSSG